jgi:hypothetical protein
MDHIYSLIDGTEASIKKTKLEEEKRGNTQALEDTLKQLQSYKETILDRIEKILNETSTNLNDDDDDRDSEEEDDEENTNTVNNNLKKIIRICFI